MERYKVGMLAESKAGHDLGHVYVIIGIDGAYIYLADGNLRTIERPKKKKKMHVQLTRIIPDDIKALIAGGGKLQNEAIKRALKSESK